MSWYKKGSAEFEEIMELVDGLGDPLVSGAWSSEVDLDEKQRRIFKKYGKPAKKASMRDAIDLLVMYLNNGKGVHDIISYERLREVGTGYPTQYLLFDACLAGLDGDDVDGLLYLDHAFNVFHFNNTFYRLLRSAIESLHDDDDARKLMAMTAAVVAPMSARANAPRYGKGYLKRFDLMVGELRKLKEVDEAKMRSLQKDP